MQRAAQVKTEIRERLRLRHRQLLEHQPVDHAEDGGIGADAQGQRQDSHNREAGVPAQHARAVTQVLPQGFKEAEAVHTVDLLAQQSGIAELAMSSGLRIFR